MVQYDTGSLNLFVSCVGVNDSKCVDRFDCAASKTCVDKKQSYNVTYDDGTGMLGKILTDRLCVSWRMPLESWRFSQFGADSTGFCTQTSFYFVCATQSNNICDGYSDGVLGMGWADPDSVATLAVDWTKMFKVFIVVLQIYQQRSICQHAMVAFWLNNLNARYNGSWQDGQYGEVTFCGTDPRHFTVCNQCNKVDGSLSSHRCIMYHCPWGISIGKSPSHASPLAMKLLRMRALTMRFWTQARQIWYCQRNCISRLVDFHNFIRQVFNLINASIDAMLIRDDDSLPCSAVGNLPVITFIINNAEYILEPHDYYIPVRKTPPSQKGLFAVPMWTAGQLLLFAHSRRRSAADHIRWCLYRQILYSVWHWKRPAWLCTVNWSAVIAVMLLLRRVEYAKKILIATRVKLIRGKTALKPQATKPVTKAR